MKKIYDFVGGRSLTFAWACLAVGSALAYFGKLTAEFTALVAPLAGIVAGRSALNDRLGNGGVTKP